MLFQGFCGGENIRFLRCPTVAASCFVKTTLSEGFDLMQRGRRCNKLCRSGRLCLRGGRRVQEVSSPCESGKLEKFVGVTWANLRAESPSWVRDFLEPHQKTCVMPVLVTFGARKIEVIYVYSPRNLCDSFTDVHFSWMHSTVFQVPTSFEVFSTGLACSINNVHCSVTMKDGPCRIYWSAAVTFIGLIWEKLFIARNSSSITTSKLCLRRSRSFPLRERLYTDAVTAAVLVTVRTAWMGRGWKIKRCLLWGRRPHSLKRSSRWISWTKRLFCSLFPFFPS